MESVLDFISVNYIWLLIIAVIILLAILGYIAEQNGFTENMKKTKKKNSKLNDLTSTMSENIDENKKNDDIDTNDDGFQPVKDVELEEELQLLEDVELEEELQSLEDAELEELDTNYNENNLNNNQDFNKVSKEVKDVKNKVNIESNEENSIELDEEDIWKF